MKERKASYHNGKGSITHNSRQFDLNKAEHIDPERTPLNVYFSLKNGTLQKVQPEEMKGLEMAFYSDTFGSYLKEYNEKRIKNGHKEQTKTIYQYYQKHQPDESLLYFGNKEHIIPRNKFLEILEDYINQSTAAFPYVKIINVSVHFDEEGAPHAHIRRAFIDDTKGPAKYGQFRALISCGFTNTTNKASDNNKIDFSRFERDLIENIMEDHGLQVDRERHPEKSGYTIAQYKALKEKDAIIKEYLTSRDLLEDFGRYLQTRRQIQTEEKIV